MLEFVSKTETELPRRLSSSSSHKGANGLSSGLALLFQLALEHAGRLLAELGGGVWLRLRPIVIRLRGLELLLELLELGFEGAPFAPETLGELGLLGAESFCDEVVILLLGSCCGLRVRRPPPISLSSLPS